MSKYTWVIPIKNATDLASRRAMEKILDESPWAPIRIVQSDNGGSFLGVFHEMLIGRGIKHIYSQAARIMSNGVVERQNGVIARALFLNMRASGTTNWADILPRIVDNLNHARSYSTGKVPYEVLRGEGAHVEALRQEVGERIQARAAKVFGGKGNILAVGQVVRKLRPKARLDKPSKVGFWSAERFRVVAVVPPPRRLANLQPYYKLSTYDGREMVKGTLPRSDLLAIPDTSCRG